MRSGAPPSYHSAHMRLLRVSILPTLACLAAVFALLPSTGQDHTMHIRAVAKGTVVPATVAIDPGQQLAIINDTLRTHAFVCVDCTTAVTIDTGDIQPGQTIVVSAPAEGRYTLQDTYAATVSTVLVVGNAPTPSPSP